MGKSAVLMKSQQLERIAAVVVCESATLTFIVEPLYSWLLQKMEKKIIVLDIVGFIIQRSGHSLMGLI